MDKPATKVELVQGIKNERKRLEEALKNFTPADMAKNSRPDAWSVKDILAHISWWEAFFVDRFEAGLRGEKQILPRWNEPGVLDDINLDIYKHNRGRELPDVLKAFEKSYQRFLTMVESIPEADMFTHGKYGWTDKSTIADYIVANSSRHYAEHRATIENLKNKS
jgi:hypothetical protein